MNDDEEFRHGPETVAWMLLAALVGLFGLVVAAAMWLT